MSTQKLDKLIVQARARNREEHRTISRLLNIADRYAALALRAFHAHDLMSARRRLDQACWAEGEALGDCEGYGWAREALGDWCPWIVRHHYTTQDGQLRLVLESRCAGGHQGGVSCRLEENDLIRATTGYGEITLLLPGICWWAPPERVRYADGAVCSWTGPIPAYVWRIERRSFTRD